MPTRFPTATRRALLLSMVLAAAALPARAADLLDTVKTRGSLRIAVEGTYPPFNFKDPKTGQLAGYDVDVAKLVCARLGVKPEFVTTEWAAILAGLGAGKYDVIVSQVGITPRRQQAFDFSRPYTYSAPQLIVRRNETTAYRSLADLKGRKVGVGQGSVFEQQARAMPGIEVKSYPAAPENLQDLAFGRIDAALNDSLMVAYLLKSSQLPIRAGARVGDVERMGIAFRKGNPTFHAAVDKALDDARADGSLRQASLKWFGVDATRAP
ncbi:cysteine ABC transporter substrate-binding protein [Massilia sp. Root133]|uniref:cystine ABC transporter substrate-binding protein n=1 Tax=unclassified Massilia TaxID=2609279 RepID=UPI0006F32D99|nr:MULTISPECIES: cystine ABC transporter substrate-binding protein [unclassified Massilia]KQX98406.1 cysteine ABC transporter substrate-binding protein [Massilia sp. Root133]KQZ47091.1 cysteine ABC transporter substrate-binding protein [Massilia sp. Root1485]